MKILVIPDVHGRTFWKEPISHIDEFEKVVFLGDYVDPYPYEKITGDEALEIFKEVIEFKRNNMEKVVLLLGNHDMHYISHSFTKSTRYDDKNAKAIRDLFDDNKDFFKIAHEETVNGKRILFTHAGLMDSWYDNRIDLIGELTVDNLNKLADSKNGINALGALSNYRTWFSIDKAGSILWSDVREKIDDPKDAVVKPWDFQVFGHTQLSEKPIITDDWACIDCRMAFIIDEDGTLKKWQ